MLNRKKIALAFPMGVSHLEEIAYGIRTYCKEHNTNWMLVSNPEKHHLQISEINPGQVDGVIGMVRNGNDIATASSFRVPVVNISGVLPKTAFPRVCPDFAAMGAMGADYFLRKGFQNFAFYGLEKIWYSQEMLRGYKGRLTENDKSLAVLEAGSGGGILGGVSERLMDWLESLPKPVALLASHDPRAVLVLQACHERGIKVPEEVSVLGSNNDGITCELAEPTLSSIVRDGERNGYEAAKLLDALLQEKEIMTREEKLLPLKVSSRESSAMVTVSDPDLIKAVAYIENSLESHVNVEAVCHHVLRSRRWLEYAFRRELKQTPKEFIDEIRLKQAKKYLAESTKYKLSAVAQMSGFNSVDQMNQLFIKKTGQKASVFRRH